MIFYNDIRSCFILEINSMNIFCMPERILTYFLNS